VLRAATEHAIIGTDREGVIAVFNGGAERLLGYAAAEVVGRATPLLFHAPDEVAERAAALGIPPGFGVFVAAARHDAPETREWTYVRADGARVPVVLTVTPMHGEDGSLVGFLGMARDISERKRAEAERDRLLEAERRARAETEQLKDEFFANVSHDLRTPVAAIKASIGVVLANEPPGTPAPLHRLLDNIDAAADRMATLVDDVLELTRVQAGRLQLEPDRYDLREVVARAAAAIEPLAQSRGQRVRVALPRRPVAAVVDAKRLERAVLNLLSNAHKYGRTGGAIRVALEAAGDEAIIAVADEGPGIAKAEQARIFQRFYRTEPPPAPAAQGPGVHESLRGGAPSSGLGLAIARAMVELHGGRIWVESEPGRGATFRIALPLAAPGCTREPAGNRAGAEIHE
jgi:PAS domain S-box-containing protein